MTPDNKSAQPGNPAKNPAEPVAYGKQKETVRGIGTTDALPVSPSMSPILDAADMPRRSTMVPGRALMMAGLALVIGAAAAGVAQLLMLMINFITDICFYGYRASVFPPAHQPPLHSSTFVLQPTTAFIGAWVIIMPVIGGLCAGFMARFGSRQIQGHGIPEAMEQILEHESEIAPRVTWLKPLSSALTIGTGGPFGAEGPIISTGGAMGSVLGQLLRVTAEERKTLLAAGAAAGMAAVFGAPVASVAMAVELLLFEFHAKSLIPVALATTIATGIRYIFDGPGPVFAMPNVAEPSGVALVTFIVLGLIVGYASVWVTRAVYFVEDMFGKSSIPWMWWPAIGAVAAGVIGYYQPLTLGVGYDNIGKLVQGDFTTTGITTVLLFGVLKFVSWAISLGSGTSGGTLAPLFMMGGALSTSLAMGLNRIFPDLRLNLGIAAVVGMGAMLSGSARALLTSVIFCFETTRQPATFLPLLGGCSAAYLISALRMKSTIMTEKIERRGVLVPSNYTADFLGLTTVAKVYTRGAVTLKATDTIGHIRKWIAQGSAESRHYGFPIVDDRGTVLGVLTLRDLLGPVSAPDTPLGSLITRGPVVAYKDTTLRQASDLMAETGVSRLVIMSHSQPPKLLGVLTRGDVIGANTRRLHELDDRARQLDLRGLLLPRTRTRNRRPQASKT